MVSCIFAFHDRVTFAQIAITELKIFDFDFVSVVARWNTLTAFQKELVWLWYRMYPTGDYYSFACHKATSASDIPARIRDEILTVSNRSALWIDQRMAAMKALKFSSFDDAYNYEVSEEMLWFALWCTASANQRTRCYAEKLLYETLRHTPAYIDKIISKWDRIADSYIQEAVIHVFSLLSYVEGHGIREFLSLCLDDPLFHLARSLKRISIGLQDPYQYIRSDKEDLYHYQEDMNIPDKATKLFWYLYIMEKYLVPFDFWTKDHISWHVNFLDVPKQDVARWNASLEREYSCVKTGECNGSYSFKDWILEHNAPPFTQRTLDPASFLSSFITCLEKTMDLYGINVYEQKGLSEIEFHNSTFRKVVDIAVDNFYGSMMANYYLNDFCSYNNVKNTIGYDFYDPIEFSDSEIYLASPVPIFESSIESLCDHTLSRITRFSTYDEKWSKNAELSITNIRNMLQPVESNGREWVLLNARIQINSQDHNEFYGIHCCTNPVIHLNGNNDRYFTIELPEYTDSIDYYSCCTDKPWLCKHIPPISVHNDWFDPSELFFPPSEIISKLHLHYVLPTMSWNTMNNEIVIRCDNNRTSNTQSMIRGAIYMRKDYYDAYSKKWPISFFCYTEKMLRRLGFTDEASLHLEFRNGILKKRFYNSNEQRMYGEVENPSCKSCPHGF